MILNNLKKCLNIEPDKIKRSLNIKPSTTLIEYSNSNGESHYKFILNNYATTQINNINASIDYPDVATRNCKSCTINNKDCSHCNKNILKLAHIDIFNHDKKIPLSQFKTVLYNNVTNLLLYLEIKCNKDSIDYADTFLVNNKIRSGEKIAISNNNTDLNDVVYVSFIF